MSSRMRWDLTVLLALAAVAAEAETKSEHRFKIHCEWEHETSLNDENHPPGIANGIAYSASGKPRQISEGPPMTVEIAGLVGTRHFMMPDVGGPLAGMTITVYRNGQSLRVQQYRIGDKLSAHATMGICKVIE